MPLGGPRGREAGDARGPGLLDAFPASACAQVPLVDVAVGVGRVQRIAAWREGCGHAGGGHAQRADGHERGQVAHHHGAKVPEDDKHLGALEAGLLAGLGAGRQAEVSVLHLRGQGLDFKRLARWDVETPHVLLLACQQDLVPALHERGLQDGEVFEVARGDLWILLSVSGKESQGLVHAGCEEQRGLRVELEGPDDRRALLLPRDDAHLLEDLDADLRRLQSAVSPRRCQPPARWHRRCLGLALGA
mmetsp:Transcript_77799/g.231745  ORF Transcript_77799/g.231745 Transcript_77799/m.231745 type:complete len:247 (-) Transcript_77799:1370-2110(-)